MNQGLDVSTCPSSTTNNIRKFIRDTELSDRFENKESTPASSAVDSHNNENKSNDEKSKEVSFHFINKSLMKELDNFNTNSKNGETKDAEQDQMPSTDKPAQDQGAQVEQNNDLHKSYQSKLRYLPNLNFNGDSIGPYSVDTYSSPFSIPNTFEYKSHPNAKKKPHLGIEKQAELHDLPEASAEKSSFRGDSSEENAGLFSEQKTEGRAPEAEELETPEWMPKELAEVWNASEASFANDKVGTDFGSSVRHIPRVSQGDGIASNYSNGNTMIHNSNSANPETPMWKRAAKEYAEIRKSHMHLQNFFLPSDVLKEDSIENKSLLKKGSSSQYVKGSILEDHLGNSVPSTLSLSTPLVTIASKNTPLNTNKVHKNNDQIHNYGTALVSDENFRLNAEGSPLKLFGNKYNTFTKGKLANLLQKINTGTPGSVNDKDSIPAVLPTLKEYEDVPASSPNAPESRFKIRNFTKSKSYTEEEFLKNANNIFDNIQKKGFRPNNLLSSSSQNFLTSSSNVPQNNSRPSDASTPERNASNAQMTAGSSSHNDDYSSYTSGFNENAMENSMGLSFEELKDRTKFNDLGQDLKEKSNSPFVVSGGQKSEIDSISSDRVDLDNELEDGYTYESTEIVSQSTYNQHDSEIHMIMERLINLENKVELITSGSIMKGMAELREENAKLRLQMQQRTALSKIDSKSANEKTLHISDYNDDLSKDFIRFKRPSELKLQNFSSPKSSPLRMKRSHATKGSLSPNLELPTTYENMVLDKKNHRWVPIEDKENLFHGSLSSIEDLTSNSKGEDENNQNETYLDDESKKPVETKEKVVKGKRRAPKMEVSFLLPKFHDKDDKISSEYDANITQVSQIGDITFSQTKKRLISLITETLLRKGVENSNWDELKEISLRGFEIDTVQELDSILPSLENIDLGDNIIAYLAGLPRSVLKLNLSNNEIANNASFAKLHDLQELDVSFNSISNLSCLANNIHLTVLNISNNELSDINGIKFLPNLRKLDISKNMLSGALDFKAHNLQNLEELDVSENQLTSISGLENLPNLRSLVANDDRIVQILCSTLHKNLKKLSLKANNIGKLDLDVFPSLRILRVDGNCLTSVSNIQRLRHLEEISFKCQLKCSLVEGVLNEAQDIIKLDISGNHNLVFLSDLHNPISPAIQFNPFLNLNSLTMCSMRLKKLPKGFSDLFPNLRELNLNFNDLKDISALSEMENLRRLYLVSNSLTELGMVVTALKKARRTVKVLDLRLNPFNEDIYPYIFNSLELELIDYREDENESFTKAPIQLESLDDIESFCVLYHSMLQNRDDWKERDTKFYEILNNGCNRKRAHHRKTYELLLLNYFTRLQFLDGSIITLNKRKYSSMKVSQFSEG